MSDCDFFFLTHRYSRFRQQTRQPSFTALKKRKEKKSNNLFLCSFPTLNKSYWTFPDQKEIKRGQEEEQRKTDMQRKGKQNFCSPLFTLRRW